GDPRSAADAVRRGTRSGRHPVHPDGAAGGDDREPRRARRVPGPAPLQCGRRRVKAFVLAGGLGTRLRPRFGDLPKGLAPPGGRPFLAHLLEWLAGAAVREVVLCAGFGAERLREALGNGTAFGV